MTTIHIFGTQFFPTTFKTWKLEMPWATSSTSRSSWARVLMIVHYKQSARDSYSLGLGLKTEQMSCYSRSMGPLILQSRSAGAVECDRVYETRYTNVMYFSLKRHRVSHVRQIPLSSKYCNSGLNSRFLSNWQASS